MSGIPSQFPDEETVAGIVERAEAIIGHSFHDKSILVKALTHPSAVEEDPIGRSYERLEFLGDAFLGGIIALEIYRRYPDINEGLMTRLKSATVSGAMLTGIMDELGFSELIIFGESERGTHSRGMRSALENVYESIVAALVLDDGVDAAHEWVARTLGPSISLDLAAKTLNPKSRLQEILQDHGDAPEYEVVAEDGPPHDRTFTVEVRSREGVIGRGSGRSKKEAEAAAAQAAIEASEA